MRAALTTTFLLLVLLVAVSGCASPQQSTPPAVRRAELERDFAVNRLKLQQSDRTILNHWQDRCDQVMPRLRAHRDDGRVSEVQWLSIQESEPSIRESLSAGHAASGRGDNAEVTRQMTYISARVRDLEDQALKLDRGAGDE